MKRLLLTTLFALTSAGAWAQEELSIDDIIHHTNHAAYYQDVSGKAKVNMTITDSQGRERTRSFVILRKDMSADEDFTGDQKFYVFFKKPADVNKTAFMVWKHLEGDDDRWLYLPALDLVKRIAASDKRTSFVGSHFFYEDVSGRNPQEDTHVLEKVDDKFYTIKSTPNSKDGVEFDYYVSTIHKASFLPVKIEYYKDGNKYRQYDAVKVAAVEGKPTVVAAKMSDIASGGATLMEYELVDYGFEVDDEIFTERYLRQPPRKELK